MNVAIAYVLASAALCWLQVTSASLLHSRGWTAPGLGLAFGNRHAMPEPSPLAGRAKRAGANAVENLVLLACVFSAAVAADANPVEVAQGTAVYFWARVAHGVLYLAGIPYLRTAAWTVSLAGLAMIGAAAL